MGISDNASMPLDTVIDQIYRDFRRVRPETGATEMVRSILGARTSGVQAMPMANIYGFDYVVRAGFHSRPWVDRKIGELTRNATRAVAGDPVPFEPDIRPRTYDLSQHLPNRGAGAALRDYYAHIGVGHAMLSTCLIDHEWRYVIFAARAPGEEPFSAESEAIMTRFMPHYRSALRARTRLIVAEGMAECCQTGVDHLGIGVVVLDGMRQIIEATPAAEAMLDARDGLLSRPTFAAASPTVNRKLQQVLRDVSRTGWTQGGIALSLPRSSGEPGYEAVIDALPCPPGVSRNGAVVVYLRDRGFNPGSMINPDLLQDLFGLTQAEALVARVAAQGYGSEKIAASLGIRQNTVRAHLRSIFAKSESSSRAALVHLMLSSLASLSTGQLPQFDA